MQGVRGAETEQEHRLDSQQESGTAGEQVRTTGELQDECQKRRHDEADAQEQGHLQDGDDLPTSNEHLEGFRGVPERDPGHQCTERTSSRRVAAAPGVHGDDRGEDTDGPDCGRVRDPDRREVLQCHGLPPVYSRAC